MLASVGSWERADSGFERVSERNEPAFKPSSDLKLREIAVPEIMDPDEILTA